jgi:hypothetical protein
VRRIHRADPRKACTRRAWTRRDHPDRALQAYSLVRKATAVDVDIVRAGAPLTLHYHLLP